jgi:hypothetical protein
MTRPNDDAMAKDRAMQDDEFCDNCGYRINLHPLGDLDDFDCEMTMRQQGIVNGFLWSVIRGR